MDVQHIPKVFWYSISASLLVVSIGLTIIAYRSSRVSIELADAKILLSSKIAADELETSKKSLKTAVKQIQSAKEYTQKEYSDLIQKNRALEAQITALEKKAKTNQSAKETLEALNAPEIKAEAMPPMPQPMIIPADPSFVDSGNNNNEPVNDNKANNDNGDSIDSRISVNGNNEMTKKIDVIEKSLDKVQMSISRLDKISQEFVEKK